MQVGFDPVGDVLQPVSDGSAGELDVVGSGAEVAELGEGPAGHGEDFTGFAGSEEFLNRPGSGGGSQSWEG